MADWTLSRRREGGARAPGGVGVRRGPDASRRPSCSSFRRLSTAELVKPESSSSLNFCFLKCKASTRPSVERVTFLCLCKEKSPKETHPGGAVSGHPALRLREGATGFVERTSVCAQRTGAVPARHPAGFSSAPSPRHRGPVRAASCRRSKGKRAPPSARVNDLHFKEQGAGFRLGQLRSREPPE